jgi:hypothetical protein
MCIIPHEIAFYNKATTLSQMKKVPETKIGNLQIMEAQSTIAYLHCFCAEAANLSIDILNEQGKSFRTHKANITPGPQKIAIKLGQLPHGQYNAWITLGQVSGIRSFTIMQDSSFSGRFKKLLGK